MVMEMATEMATAEVMLVATETVAKVVILRDWFGKSRSKGGKPGWVQGWECQVNHVLDNLVKNQNLNACPQREQA